MVVVGIAALAALVWWRSRTALMSESLFRVEFDEATISVTDPEGVRHSVPWSALTKVAIRTTDAGPHEPDVFWGFHAGSSTPSVVFPQGATGEDQLLEALQSRLPGFRNDQLIQAAGSTSNTFFVLWESSQPPP